MRKLRNLRDPDQAPPARKIYNGKGRNPTKRMITNPQEIPAPNIPGVSIEDVTAEMVKRSMLELELIVLEARLGGLGPRHTARLIVREHKDRWNYETVMQTINRVQLELDAECVEITKTERARQIASLQQDLARQRAAPRPNWQAIRGHEELLGRITGTLKPIRVEVDVMATLKASLATVLVDMTDDDRDRIVREQMELEERVRGMLPAPQAAE